jgi:hypothetical protein
VLLLGGAGGGTIQSARGLRSAPYLLLSLVVAAQRLDARHLQGDIKIHIWLRLHFHFVLQQQGKPQA